jgi:pilus assembly protein CpaB
VSETILRNIRVLAVDQRINTRDENGNQVARNRDTVTLEVTPRMAEKIAVAQRLGAMSLSLRSIADNDAELERAIAAGEIDVPEGDDADAERSMMAAIANRPSEGSTTYTVGGDVSRFERRTVPGSTEVNTAQPGDPAYQGPVVRIARRNNEPQVVPVGAR